MIRLPTDAKARKAVPLYKGLLKYFPDALCAVAELSRIGNEQHSPGQPLHWDRSKSSDQHDALMRHLVESGTVDADGVRHSTKVAWRALALLQLEIEESRAPPRGDNWPYDHPKFAGLMREMRERREQDAIAEGVADSKQGDGGTD